MNIKLRQANLGDVPKLKELWQICFNDRMRYIDIFFENMFIPEKTLIAQADDDLAGVVYVLERTFLGKPFYYGYAIGVFPRYRGRNICKIMLDHIKNAIKDEDTMFGLHPANEKLADFYKRIGLQEMYSLKIVDVTDAISNTDKNCFLEDIEADEFYTLRENAFKNSVKWSKNTLSYILKNGETVKKTNIDGHECYFVLSKQNNTLLVKETTANDDEIINLTGSLKKEFAAKKVLYLLPNSSALKGEVKPMIYGFSDKNDDVYMNLFLD